MPLAHPDAGVLDRVIGFGYTVIMRTILIASLILLLLPSMAMSKIVTKTVEYSHEGTTFRGFLAYDGSVEDPRPGVLICPEWWGLNDYAKRRAQEVAELGYVAFVMDPYGEGKVVTAREDAQRLAGALYAPDGQTGVRELMRGRAAAAMKTLKTQPQTDPARLAAMGYCMGGTVSLELARAGVEGENLRAVVSFHGGLSTPKPEVARDVKASILVCHGSVDPFVPPAEVAAFQKEMDVAGADYQLISYSGAVHSFTNPAAKGEIPGAKHDPNAERRSWQHMKQFLAERLDDQGDEGTR